jgi:hypothetical protein
VIVICHACKKPLSIKRRVGRLETCPTCGSDLHVCLNCTFYSPGAYNECREPQAERVVEKARSNFCDQFVFTGATSRGTDAQARKDARSQLDALFKKS